MIVLWVLLLPGRAGLPPLATRHLFASGPETAAVVSRPMTDWLHCEFAREPHGKSLADFGVYLYPESDYLGSLNVFFSHDEDFRMDSLRLTFRGGSMTPPVAIEAPSGGPWAAQHFSYDNDGRSITWSADHLGLVGTGSLELHFFMRVPSGLDPASTYSVRAVFTLRSKGTLQLVQYAADGTLEFPLAAFSVQRSGGGEVKTGSR